MTLASRHVYAWAASAILHAAFLGVLLRTAPRPLSPPERPSLIFVELASSRAGSAQPQAAPPPPDPPAVVARPKGVVAAKPRPRRAEPAPPAATSAPAEGSGESAGEAHGPPSGTHAGRGDGPFLAAAVARPPVVRSRVLPIYPPAARARGVQGQVLLEAIVDRAGHVEPEVRVLRSVPLLDDAAIVAVRQWHFTPGANREGDLVRVVLEVPVRFQLR
jgi:protein TonB